jgi:hypothetical protein
MIQRLSIATLSICALGVSVTATSCIRLVRFARTREYCRVLEAPSVRFHCGAIWFDLLASRFGLGPVISARLLVRLFFVELIASGCILLCFEAWKMSIL